MDKLPKVFANKNIRNANNNSVYYSKLDEKNKRPSLIGKSVRDKIDAIFNAKNYIYKADVEITLEDKTITKRIIGRGPDYILTMQNERININDIIDINYDK